MAFTELNVNGARVSNVGTPTENTDAANKQYVDDKAGLPNCVKIMNTNGKTAMSYILQSTNSFIRIIPAEINEDYVLYAVDIYWFTNPADFVIAPFLSAPIQSGEMLLADVITHDLMDESKVEFNASSGEISIKANYEIVIWTQGQ